ncbi:MAG: hypothetical protein B9S32_03370 [Verrucomicrobia bacterium Tous-C9LFEB]|nr:MAG: hypothetical protein B9S32_03370 [Verrucomicrobia bacterium Tous-C9LFEB]
MNNLTLGKKIAYGFGALILISLILGGIAVVVMQMSSSSAQILAKEYAAELEVVSDLQTNVATAQLAVRTYGLTGDEAQYEIATKGLQQAKVNVEDAKKLAEVSPHLPKLKAEVGPYAEALSKYATKFEETVKIQREIKSNITQVYANGAQFASNINLFFDTQFVKLQEEMANKAAVEALKERSLKVALAAKVRNEGNQARLAAARGLIDRDPAQIAKSLPRFDEIDRTLAEIAPLVHQPSNIEQLNKVKESVENYKAAMTKLGELMETNTKVLAERNVYAKAMREGTDKIYEAALKSTVGTANLSTTSLSIAKGTMIVGLLIAIGVGVALAVVITRSITVPVHRLIERLTAGSEQTSSAAGQVSAASQSLAEGASEQAASLEETSSSLEEMASMTEHNAENASNAKTLASEARMAADAGTGEMVKMNTAMEAIKKSSDDISKIIKTIDEIAFQTNILALNAAVEAARAGEAGMGFAVVADEVRNLAHRSAIAAKETADKIQDAIAKSGQGVEISALVSEKLKEVVDKAHKVDELVAEIASASKEQSTGITQVNVAVSQMDKVTQNNAASAEETAAAAEELNAQSEELRSAVKELQFMVGGAGESSIASHLMPVRKLIQTKVASAKASMPTATAPAHAAKREKSVTTSRNAGTSTGGSRHSEPIPDESIAVRGKSAIPMEDDFKDM